MPAHLDAGVSAMLAAADQRYTSGRRKLVDVLHGAGRPLSIPDILAAGAGMPQSSVYRNLGVLEQAGAVHRVRGAGEFARYELAEELTEQHHHHLVCTLCGSVEDFIVSDLLERTLDRAIDEVSGATGFVTVDHRLDLVGLCARCARSRRAHGRSH